MFALAELNAIDLEMHELELDGRKPERHIPTNVLVVICELYRTEKEMHSSR